MYLNHDINLVVLVVKQHDLIITKRLVDLFLDSLLQDDEVDDELQDDLDEPEVDDELQDDLDEPEVGDEVGEILNEIDYEVQNEAQDDTNHHELDDEVDQDDLFLKKLEMLMLSDDTKEHPHHIHLLEAKELLPKDIVQAHHLKNHQLQEVVYHDLNLNDLKRKNKYIKK
jgi:hypothetical protein